MPENKPDGYVASLRSIAARSVARMYSPGDKTFLFCLRDVGGVVRPEGLSRRYTAMTLIGLAGEEPATVRSILGEHTTAQVYEKLIEDVTTQTNLGDVAVAHWAGAALKHPAREKSLARLRALKPEQGAQHTVELAWALMALSVDPASPAPELRDAVAKRLVDSQNERVFPHLIGGSDGLRTHVACFADLVYPTQALAHHHRATNDPRSLAAASACGDYMCETQGPAGQWWWHHDHRTGKVLEGYPVYAVHQDAMAPMALFDLAEVSGKSYDPWIRKGLEWLARSPELDGGSLVDPQADIIWRKVARREPNKLARSLQAVASGLHPSLRVPGLDTLLPPVTIDREDRPYHLGWLFYAFPPRRAEFS